MVIAKLCPFFAANMAEPCSGLAILKVGLSAFWTSNKDASKDAIRWRPSQVGWTLLLVTSSNKKLLVARSPELAQVDIQPLASKLRRAVMEAGGFQKMD